MVRKWSYITHPNTLTSPNTSRDGSIIRPKKTLNTSICNFNTFAHFKFKIFRKNTRFKNYSLFSTIFVRRKVSLWNRRSDWKNYVVLSSKWVKLMSKQKHLISFSQSSNLFNFSFREPYPQFLKKNTADLVGVTSNKLNTRFKSLLYTTTWQNLIQTSQINNQRVIQCYSTTDLTKLEKLTSLTFYLSYNRIKYPSQNLLNKTSCDLSPSNLIVSTLLPNIILITKVIKTIYIYLILYTLQQQK